MKKITELTAELAAPAIAEQGCTLWDVEYVKEAGTWYLRVLIDKEGGVDILDCEAISRKLSDLLDEADPIEEAYYLEVSSPGVERELRNRMHLDACEGWNVEVRLYAPQDGVKSFRGELLAVGEQGEIRILAGEKELSFAPEAVAKVKTYFEF